MNSVIVKHPSSDASATVIMHPREDGSMRLVVEQPARKLADVIVSPPKLRTHEVGVVYNDVVLGAASAHIYTYDALQSLDLVIGDQVECPVGNFRNNDSYGHVLGTVVTLKPAESPVPKKLITSRS